MADRVEVAGLSVARELRDFLDNEALPGTGVTPDRFWASLAAIIRDLGPRNAALLAKRDDLQAKIDAWHHDHPGRPIDLGAYTAFLREIGYLVPEGPAFQVSTTNVDAEIGQIAGPQLVVPVSNARYALNAANARWGSLYDALYGTDAIPDSDGAARGRGYNPARGKKVIAFARGALDRIAPLAGGASHGDARSYAITAGALAVTLQDGRSIGLAQPGQCVGYQGEATAPQAILFVHHGLHAELRIDHDHPIGKDDPAGIADLVMESAVTTIVDARTASPRWMPRTKSRSTATGSG
jgi:malate synthase